MELRLLRYFLAVAREGNITRAAEDLHITQPTLSRQMAQLEEELGCTLFRRGGRKLELTQEGMLLRRRAEEMLQLEERIQRELTGTARELSGVVTIGSGESAAARFLPDLIQAFHGEHPLVRYQLVTGNADQIMEQMDLGLIDMALLMEPVDLEKYQYLTLPQADHWGVLMPAGDPLAQKEAVSPRDLDGRPVMVSYRPSVEQQLATLLGEDFQRMEILSTHNLIRNTALLVEQGLGYAITLQGAVEIYDDRRVCFRLFRPELPCRAVLAWKEHQVQSPAAAGLLACAKMLLGYGDG